MSMSYAEMVRCGWKVRRCAAVGLFAGPTYASFVLSRIMRSPLSQSRAFISEMEIAGQPHALIYRGSDVVGGLMIALLGFVLPRASRCRAARVGTAAFAVAGLASVLDGVDPMRCAPSLSLVCRGSDRSLHGLLGQWEELHSVSAVLGVLAFIMAMAATAVALRAVAPRAALLSASGAAVVSILNILELIVMVRDGAVGVPERASVSVISLWLLYISGRLLAYRPDRTIGPDGTGQGPPLSAP